MARTAVLVLGITLMLASCDDNRRRSDVTAPDGGPPLEGALLRPVTGGPAMLAINRVGTEQAATAGRASGHSTLGPLAFPPSNRVDRMSFVALSTDEFPFARGEMDWESGQGPGTELRAHVNIECLSITENQAWLSGTGSFKRDGEEGTFFFQWSVQDNGEGAQSSPDMSSQLFFADSPQDCHLRLEPPIFELESGNIQVTDH